MTHWEWERGEEKTGRILYKKNKGKKLQQDLADENIFLTKRSDSNGLDPLNYLKPGVRHDNAKKGATQENWIGKPFYNVHTAGFKSNDTSQLEDVKK